MSPSILIAAADGGGFVLQPVVEWFHLEDAWRKWLIAFGVLGQMIFFSRWIIQWIATERRGASHVPELFWWLSLLGAMMLLTYFVIDRDPVGILGQGVGWVVYGRNLYLIRIKNRDVTVT